MADEQRAQEYMEAGGPGEYDAEDITQEDCWTVITSFFDEMVSCAGG